MASQPLLNDDEFNSTKHPTPSPYLEPANDDREANLGQSSSSSVQGDISFNVTHSPMVELEYLYQPDTQIFLRRECAATEALECESSSWQGSIDHGRTEEVKIDDPFHEPVADVEWQPYTIKWPFLSLLTILTLAILVAVVAM